MVGLVVGGVVGGGGGGRTGIRLRLLPRRKRVAASASFSVESWD